jgi:ankyrin repeat protein
MPRPVLEFFAAARAGDAAAVGAFLDQTPELIDARERKQDGDELQAIHMAAEAGHLHVVRLLVERGATVYSHPFSTYPAVIRADWAKRSGDPARQQLVIDYFLHEIPHLAAGTGDVGVMCNLAGRQGWKDQVARHLARDPKVVHQRGWIGDTPLHWPAHNAHTEIVRMLLAAGADPNAEENNWIGGTPLHWASERNSEIIRLLIAAGGDVNARVTRPNSHHAGATPLIWCAKQRDDDGEAARTLLESGADPALTDSAGKTALDYARPNIAAVLRSR